MSQLCRSLTVRISVLKLAQAKCVMCNDSVQFQRRHEKLTIVVHVLQNTQDFVISRCYFAEDGKEMYKDSKRTCITIVPLIKRFVWSPSRCRRRGGLLKLPIVTLRP